MKCKSYKILLIIAILFTGMQTTACSLIALCPPPEPCPSPAPCSTPEPCPTIMGKSSLVGTWEGSTGTTTITFRFEDDGDFIYLMNGSEVGRGQYAVLDTIDPEGLVMVFEDGTVLYPIFSIIDNNTLQIENALPGEPRPVGFSDYLIMTRFTP